MGVRRLLVSLGPPIRDIHYLDGTGLEKCRRMGPLPCLGPHSRVWTWMRLFDAGELIMVGDRLSPSIFIELPASD